MMRWAGITCTRHLSVASAWFQMGPNSVQPRSYIAVNLEGVTLTRRLDDDDDVCSIECLELYHTAGIAGGRPPAYTIIVITIGG